MTPSPYQPPFTPTAAILRLAAEIGEAVGRLSAREETVKELRLRRLNRIRTVQGSLAIEGNTLSTEQITAIMDGKRVLAPPRDQADSAPFVAFMLQMIAEAVSMEFIPQVTPQVTPQVGLLLEKLTGEMSREELQRALDLKDRKSFREGYLKPALAQGLVEMTIPEKPNSRLQKYRLTDRGRHLRAGKERL